MERQNSYERTNRYQSQKKSKTQKEIGCHSFNTEVATHYGVNISIFLGHISFWIKKNIESDRHYHDGNYWTYNTIQGFIEIFPYWTRHQLEYVIQRCIEEKLLIEGNYNTQKYDRTKWYSLTVKGLSIFGLSIDEDEGENENEHESLEPLSSLISENSEMDFGKLNIPFRKIPKPIPYINTDIKTDIKSSRRCGTEIKTSASPERLKFDNIFQLRHQAKTGPILQDDDSTDEFNTKSGYQNNQT